MIEDYDLRQQLKDNIHWESYSYMNHVDYLSYKGLCVGHVTIVKEALNYYVQGEIYENII